MKEKVVKNLGIEEPMPIKKVDPFSLTRPKATYVTKKFTDALHPDVELVLSLKSLDQAEVMACFDLAAAYEGMYLGTPEKQAEMVFPPVGGRSVAISKTLIQNACVLFTMQQAEGDAAYTVEQLIALSVTMPNAWADLAKTITEIQNGRESKNA